MPGGTAQTVLKKKTIVYAEMAVVRRMPHDPEKTPRCTMFALDHSRHSRYPGVSRSPQLRTLGQHRRKACVCHQVPGEPEEEARGLAPRTRATHIFIAGACS